MAEVEQNCASNLTRCDSYSSITNYELLDPEKTLSAFGKYGRYQMITYVLIASGLILFSADVLVMTFIALPPKFQCHPPDNDGISMLNTYIEIDQCNLLDPNNQTVSCLKLVNATFTYSEPVQYSTINSEFNLVCEDEHWAQHGSSLFLLGGVIMTPIITQLSDLYGRRNTFLLPMWVSVIANFGCVITPSYTLFLLFRFIAGVGIIGSASIGMVFCCESVAPKFRTYISFVNTVTWVIGIAAVGLLRMYIKSWRLLYLSISLPGLLTILHYWYLPESLYWMTKQHKRDKIKRYIEMTSKVNSVRICLQNCLADDEQKNEQETSKTFVDMIKCKRILFHLIVQCTVMALLNIGYWGLTLLSTQLSQDPFVGYFLTGFIEIPGSLIAILLLLKFGRRTISFFSLLLQAVFMVLAAIFPGDKTFAIIFPILGKLFNVIVWCGQPLLIAEMIPTPIRNTFFGIVLFWSHIGAVFSPYLKFLNKLHSEAPQMTVAVVSFISALLMLTAPETKDKPMPKDFDQFDPGWLFKSKSSKQCTTKSSLKSGDKQLTEGVHTFVILN